jgi:hypothetical protein
MGKVRRSFGAKWQRWLIAVIRWGAPVTIFGLIAAGIVSGFGFIECGWTGRGTFGIQKYQLFLNNAEPIGIKFSGRRLDVDITKDVNIYWDNDLVPRAEWMRSIFALPSLEIVRNPGEPPQWQIIMPMWPPIVVLSGITWLCWRGRVRRPSEHRCTKCGYDLTGTRGAVCPECGTASEPGKTGSVR